MRTSDELDYVSTGCCSACIECQQSYGFESEEEMEAAEVPVEGWVGSAACDECGDTMQGMRYDAHGVDPKTGEIVHFEVCEDCMLALNGLA